jgi:hypothetical protein
VGTPTPRGLLHLRRRRRGVSTLARCPEAQRGRGVTAGVRGHVTSSDPRLEPTALHRARATT